jgi:hypothetical protein
MRAIVSFANERGNYIKALERLGESLKGNTDATFFPFIGEESIGAPNHLDNPYSFKIYAIEKVKAQGYKQILWLDSSVVLRKDISPIFEEMESRGYIMQEAGCYVGEWCNDKTLQAFNITRNEAMTMPCYGNAGLLGLNFYSRTAYDFFYRWKWAMQKGLFIGEWNNDNKTESQDERCKGHRHDLVCGSIIACQLAMRYKSGLELLQYSSPDEPLINDSIYFSAEGM